MTRKFQYIERQHYALYEHVMSAYIVIKELYQCVATLICQCVDLTPLSSIDLTPLSSTVGIVAVGGLLLVAVFDLCDSAVGVVAGDGLFALRVGGGGDL